MSAKKYNEATRDLALLKISRERKAQDDKFGEQNCPDFDARLYHPGYDGRAIADHYEIPTESRGKFICQNAFKSGRGDFMSILVEEVAEVGGAFRDEEALKTELIQVAAVCVKWYEAICRRQRGK